ncbi:MAG: histidine phosphatase family protein [Pyrinomonadaceae bacterium]|nr:histidine phosphatase family protein [Pyrinomonadaceae bacterium]MCX7639092.1 histidine phosphatase family protein [Pyrinomonadaceae bacterium]MDW8303687.1 histidine phosphatase family protein [Acidobacteriota bacterium]
MKLTRLFLVRHGQSEKNAERRFGGHSATPLSALGKRQALATAKALEKERIDLIFSSDLVRAVQTAEPLSKLLKVEVQKTQAFRERNVGVLEGLTFEEAAQKYPEDYQALITRDFLHVIKNGESYFQLLQRVSTKLEQILAENEGKNIVIFTHTGVICFTSLYLLGAINENTKNTPWLVTSNCGICKFEFRGRKNVRLLAFNETSHLEKITGNDAFASK